MTTPTINVNQAQCVETCQAASYPTREHLTHCTARPVFIPCPVPRSFPCTVRLGKCWDSARQAILPMAKASCGLTSHHEQCPARPVKASCSIGGDGTWAGSEVVDIVTVGPTGKPREVIAVSHERWALVKALMLGKTPRLTGTEATDIPVVALIEKRDAVFSALADLARLEQGVWEAQERAVMALGEPTFLPDNYQRAEPQQRASTSILARFLERLIAQVGAMDGAAPNPSIPSNSSGDALRPVDMDLMCIACDQCTLHRWMPSPDAGPGWRCSECSALSKAGRYPCSPTCTHDDARTPDHPERVKERSLKLARAALGMPEKEQAEAFNTHLDQLAVEEAREAGAEAMRTACLEAVRELLQKWGSPPGAIEQIKKVIEGAAP